FFAIPSIIHIAKVKHLVDVPGERRSHHVPTPSLGGIGIFAGVIFSILMWTPFTVFGELQYILCAFILIFLIGAKDDIIPMSPTKKLVGELLAATIIALKADIRITSFYGVFGVNELSFTVSIILSIFIIIVIINSFNLIDGINGLSGSIGTLISVVLGAWFYLTENLALSIIAFSLAGALIAFLKYNFTPAKIFMGDTGALLVGLISAILIIKFIEVHRVNNASPYLVKAVPAVAIGILILPLFDTLRVFITRILNGRSPLYPDRTHIHHLMLDLGFSHMQATAILVFVNLIFIIIAFLFQNIGTLNLLVLILTLATILSSGLYNAVNKKKMRRMSM
ncbi:MAG: MraY family glycosyltransferase, partial [Saprospiraceae bacterium]